MAKDPAFLFYPNDWLGGTLGMSFEEKGAYIELLMLQFNRGHMDGHMCGQVVGQIWDKIKTKFVQDPNGLWYNERLEEEQNKRKSFTMSRKNNLLGVNQYTKKDGHKNGHMTFHMENENKDSSYVLKGGVGEKHLTDRKKEFFEKVIAQFQEQHPPQLLNDFCEYWTEHNEGGRKMRFEMQKIFNVKRRITTWVRNNNKVFQKSNVTQVPKIEKATPKLYNAK